MKRQHQAATQIQVSIAMVSQLHLAPVHCNTALPRDGSIAIVTAESTVTGLLEESLAEELVLATKKSSYCNPGLCSSSHCPKALRKGEVALSAANAKSTSDIEDKPTATAGPLPRFRSLGFLVSLPQMMGFYKVATCAV